MSRTVRLLLAGAFWPVLLAPQSAPQPASAPVSDSINSRLPSWVRFSGEERVRMEQIAGQNFAAIGDLYVMNRLRLNLELRPLRWLLFSFQAEDARVFGQNADPAPASQKNAMDLRLGWVQLGGDEGAASLRLGRQRLDFGDGRLLADPNWSNVGRSFDAARLSLRRRLLKLDLFSGAAVKVDPTGFDEPAPGAHFYGAYGSLGGWIPRAVIEPYLFWRLEHTYKNEIGASGNLDEKTSGFRWAGKFGRSMDYTAEVALQTGSWAGDRISAWMVHWLLGYTLAGTKHRPRLYLEYDRNSGDRALKDGRHGTFDGLFAASHDKYGLTDLICSSNALHGRSGLQYPLHPKVTVGGAYNEFWLASASDGLYIGGKLLARSADGAAGTHVGREVDAQAQWSPSSVTQISAGYGRLFPGEFLRHTTSGMPYGIVFWNVAQRF